MQKSQIIPGVPAGHTNSWHITHIHACPHLETISNIVIPWKIMDVCVYKKDMKTIYEAINMNFKAYNWILTTLMFFKM